MNINIQIDRLILEGINLSPSQRARLQASVEAELSLLLTVNGLPPHLQNGGNIPRLPASINITNNMNPTQMGQEIAQAMFVLKIRKKSNIYDKVRLFFPFITNINSFNP